MTQGKLTDWGLLALRLGLATLLIWFHGWARLGRAAGFAILGQPWGFVDVVGTIGFPMAGSFAVLSALAESIAPLLLALGVLARPAAALVAINMAVASASEAV